MSARDKRELELLRIAHANRETTAAEDERLRELVREQGAVGADAAGPDEAELREIEDLHQLFREERKLREEALVEAVSPGERADEGFRRLEQAAAQAEDQLRAKLRHVAAGQEPVVTVRGVGYKLDA